MPKKITQQRPLYVNLYNPEIIRKDLLKAAILSVELLEKFEYAKELKALKRERLKRADDLIKDAVSAVYDLRRSLPQGLLKKKDEKVMRETKITRPQPQMKPKHAKKHNVELKRLENELYEIKNKLTSLDI